MEKAIIAALAPNGVLRTGINMSNFLLVSCTLPSGMPDGISPDITRRIAIAFQRSEIDILASLKPKLLEKLNASYLYKLIEPPFTMMQQSVGIRKGQPVVRDFFNNLITNLIKRGFVAASLKTLR